MNNIDLLSSIREQILDKKEEYRRKEKDLSKVIGYIDCCIDLLDIIIKIREGEKNDSIYKNTSSFKSLKEV